MVFASKFYLLCPASVMGAVVFGDECRQATRLWLLCFFLFHGPMYGIVLATTTVVSVKCFGVRWHQCSSAHRFRVCLQQAYEESLCIQ